MTEINDVRRGQLVWDMPDGTWFTWDDEGPVPGIPSDRPQLALKVSENVYVDMRTGKQIALYAKTTVQPVAVEIRLLQNL